MFLLLVTILVVLSCIACVLLWFPIRGHLRQEKGRLFWLPVIMTPLLALGLAYPNINEYVGQLEIQRQMQAHGGRAVLAGDLADLRRRLDAEPHNARLRFDLGRAYLVLGNRSLAKEMLDHPSLAENQDALALLLRAHYGDRARTSSDWDVELQQRLDALQRVNARHPTLLSVQAARYAEGGDHTNAVLLWRQLLTTDLDPTQRQRIEILIRQSEQADRDDG